jgi:hypothetical protein
MITSAKVGNVVVVLHLAEMTISYNVSKRDMPSTNHGINNYFDLFLQNVHGYKTKSSRFMTMCALLIFKLCV